MEVWEYLCEQEPANAEYALELAESYGQRGWRKKAYAQYLRTLELDKNNSECWLSFIRCHIDADEWDEARAICVQALDVVGEQGEIDLYLCAFGLYEGTSPALAEQSLQIILRKAKEARPGDEDFEAIVFELLRRIEGNKSIRLYPYVKELASLLPHTNDKLREHLVLAEQNYEIEGLEEKGFDEMLHDLLLIMNSKEDSREWRNNRMALEYLILSKKDGMLPQLLRLQKEHPALYDLHKDFFDEALATRNLERMVVQRTQALARQNLQPAGYAEGEDWEDEPVATVRRETPKVGRNDPCPCGSGKKYKKCCGA
jgi:tetratricopeptide (TPR) repeat protein